LGFENYLIRAADNNFRLSTVIFNDTGNANPFTLKRCLRRILKFISVRSPDKNRENLLWVGLIKIEKSGPSLGSNCIGGTHHCPTNCLLHPSKFVGVYWIDVLLLSNRGGRTNQKSKN